MKIYFELFFAFLKTGLFTFGGGYAMLPILKEEIVLKHKWLTEEEIVNYFSIGQCTPGIIAVNVATFCGYKLKKSWGSIVSVTALILPSLFIIMTIASFFKMLPHCETINHLLNGIRIGVTALLIQVVCSLCAKIYDDYKNKILPCIIFALSAIGLIVFRMSAVLIVILTLLSAVVLFLRQRIQR